MSASSGDGDARLDNSNNGAATMLNTTNEIRAALSKAVTLEWEYQASCAKNYYRTDLTRNFVFTGPRLERLTYQCNGHSMMGVPPCGLEFSIVRDLDAAITGPSWCGRCNGSICCVKVEPIASDTPVTVLNLPIPETRDEWERVGLEQHRLHVRLHEAKTDLQGLLARLAPNGSEGSAHAR